MEYLTLETFKTKIFDFEKEKDWKFLGDKPTVIDFYASWCGPCKMIAPILEELSKEYTDINFYKVDTEKEQELSSIFDIKSIPTLLFIPLVNKPHITQGALPKDTFKRIFKEIFNIE